MKKKAYITKTVDGKTVESYPLTAADDDWIRAGRLAEKAEAGDEQAAKVLAEMEATEMFTIPEGTVDELPIDPVKDKKFNDWMQSITFVKQDGTLEDMEWHRGQFEPDPEDED